MSTSSVYRVMHVVGQGDEYMILGFDEDYSGSLELWPVGICTSKEKAEALVAHFDGRVIA